MVKRTRCIAAGLAVIPLTQRIVVLTGWLISSFILVGLFAGCAAASATPSPISAERLHLQRSGGIIGLDDSLQIDLVEGRAVLVRGQAQKDMRLDEATLTRARATA